MNELRAVHNESYIFSARVLALRWDRAIAHLLLVLAVCWLGSKLLALPIYGLAYAAVISAYSFKFIFLLAAACIFRGRKGAFLMLLSLLVSWLACVWYLSSLVFFIAQSRHLSFEELRFRLTDPGSRDVVLRILTSEKMLIFNALFWGGYFALAWLCSKMSSKNCLCASVLLMALILPTGAILVHNRDTFAVNLASKYLEAYSAPWSGVHSYRQDYERSLDEWYAGHWRNQNAFPFWVDGPAEKLHQLAGRYAGRDVILVLMESQRASDIAGFGDGAFNHQPCAPFMTSLRDKSLSFDSYYAAGDATATALWAIFTGLPDTPDFPFPILRNPDASRFGRGAQFRQAGYEIQGLCPAPPRFDNWDRIFSTVGGTWWIDHAETDHLSRQYWAFYGMPDEHLYDVALKRYQRHRGTKPQFMTLLTVSNHYPYAFPRKIDGEHYPADHIGGMKYADRCLKKFVQALQSLPQDQQPIVFITSDTGHHERLGHHKGLEAIRVPGLLLLPDGFLAGEHYDHVFGHEDVLDLLYIAVMPDAARSEDKFVKKHRQVVTSHGGYFAVSDNAFYAKQVHKFSKIYNKWQTIDGVPAADKNLLQEAQAKYSQYVKLLWP